MVQRCRLQRCCLCLTSLQELHREEHTIPSRDSLRQFWEGNILNITLQSVHLWQDTRLPIWLHVSCLHKGFKSRITSHRVATLPNQWDPTQHSCLILHNWLPAIYTVKGNVSWSPKACIFRHRFKRSSVINYFHWLQRTYQFATPKTPPSKSCGCRENRGNNWKEDKWMLTRLNVNGLYRTEYCCSVTLLDLEIWSNTNAMQTLLLFWLTFHTPGPVFLTNLQGRAWVSCLFKHILQCQVCQRC